MLNQALNDSILRDRTLGYRRMALALGAVLVTLYTYRDANFTDLSFFGVKPGPGQEAGALVRKVIWFLLVYNVTYFVYHSSLDVRIWMAKVLESPSVNFGGSNAYFPEWQMYFGFPPYRIENRQQSNGGLPEPREWKQKKESGSLTWSAPPRTDGPSLRYYKLSLPLVRRFREVILALILAYLAPPILLLLWALACALTF